MTRSGHSHYVARRALCIIWHSRLTGRSSNVPRATRELSTHSSSRSPRHSKRSPGQTLTAKADAIHRNQQLWTLLATDLLNPANSLPTDLKSRLLQLSKFVQKTSMEILSGRGDIADLIEINRPIIAGLGGSVQSGIQGEAA